MKNSNKAIVVGAALVVAGFFFGWFGLRGGGTSFSISGWRLAEFARNNGIVYYLVYLLPLGALLAGVSALRGARGAARFSMAVGGIFLAWGVFEVVSILYRTTFLGLWMTAAGVVTLFVAGLAGRK